MISINYGKIRSLVRRLKAASKQSRHMVCLCERIDLRLPLFFSFSGTPFHLRCPWYLFLFELVCVCVCAKLVDYNIIITIEKQAHAVIRNNQTHSLVSLHLWLHSLIVTDFLFFLSRSYSSYFCC